MKNLDGGNCVPVCLHLMKITMVLRHPYLIFPGKKLFGLFLSILP
jgi:hypothetical protein